MNNIINHPDIIINPIRLQTVIKDSKIISDSVVILHNNIDNLPKGMNLIGIAQNVMLGVFWVEYIEDKGYYCSRIMIDNNKIIIGDAKFPITNMEHVDDVSIDCNIDYLIGRDTIARLEI